MRGKRKKKKEEEEKGKKKKKKEKKKKEKKKEKYFWKLNSPRPDLINHPSLFPRVKHLTLTF